MADDVKQECSVLEVKNLSKSYGETRALEDASINFASATIHAILGENGSGKSTLVKLLSGVVAPTSGSVIINGEELRTFEPAAVQGKGVATVFQEVLVAPARSVADNILLGQDGLLHRAVPRRDRVRVSEDVIKPLARNPIDVRARAGDLPLAVRQIIVLARALARRPRILILDEVSAALDFSDREVVFGNMEAFAQNGGLIVFISHRMDEVMRLAHRVTILRGGTVVGSYDKTELSAEQMLSLMAPAAAKDLEHAH